MNSQEMIYLGESQYPREITTKVNDYLMEHRNHKIDQVITEAHLKPTGRGGADEQWVAVWVLVTILYGADPISRMPTISI